MGICIHGGLDFRGLHPAVVCIGESASGVGGGSWGNSLHRILRDTVNE